MKITDLKGQVKNAKRVSVYLDGNYYCGLDLITVMQARLKVGDEITKEKLIEIQRDSEMQACMDCALRSLSKSVKTEKDIIKKLESKGFLKEMAIETVEKLKGYGYINDQYYSNRYAETYKKSKGKKLIKLELKQKGVDEKVIDETLNGIENELETAIAIAEKYCKNKEKDVKLMQKCYKYLLSKGFSYDDSLTATKQVLGEEEN